MASNEERLGFVIVNVFTQTRYQSGNPLAIVYLPDDVPVTQDRKQVIAREFALSETVFLHTPPAADGTWTIDIFTTDMELPFAGHPTIGTAVRVLQDLATKEDTSRQESVKGAFMTKAGRLEISFNPGTGFARAVIPQKHHIHAWSCPVEQLFEKQRTLNASSLNDPSSGLPVVSIVDGMTFILTELSSLESLSQVVLQQGYVTCSLDKGWSRPQRPFYFYVRLPNDEDGTMRFRTRLFMKTTEDPATGSAACALVGYIAKRESEKVQWIRAKVTQGVEMGRECEIGVEVDRTDEGRIKGVYLSGSAVQVMSGQLTL